MLSLLFSGLETQKKKFATGLIRSGFSALLNRREVSKPPGPRVSGEELAAQGEDL